MTDTNDAQKANADELERQIQEQTSANPPPPANLREYAERKAAEKRLESDSSKGNN